MQSKKQSIFRNPLLWEALCGALIVVVAIVSIVAVLTQSDGSRDRGDEYVPKKKNESSSSSSTTATDPTEPLPVLKANPLKSTDFIVNEKGFLTCQTQTAMLGISVTQDQQLVDYAQLKEAGVEFVMIRAAWYNPATGKTEVDGMAASHHQYAKEAGLKIGAFVDSSAISVAEATSDAQRLLGVIAEWKLDLPVSINWSLSARTTQSGTVSPDLLSQCIWAFTDTILAANLQPMVQFSADSVSTQFRLADLTKAKLWLVKNKMEFDYRVDMWQYGNEIVPGTRSSVPISLYFQWAEPEPEPEPTPGTEPTTAPTDPTTPSE